MDDGKPKSGKVLLNGLSWFVSSIPDTYSTTNDTKDFYLSFELEL